MKKLVQSKWKLLVVLIALAIMGRIIYVNAAYPKTKLQYYGLDDVVEYHEFQIVCHGAEVYGGLDFLQYVKNVESEFQQEKYDEVIGSSDAYVYIVNLSVQNVSGETQQFHSKKASFCIGNTVNCSYNMYLTGLLNEGDIKFDIQPGETVDMSVVYHLTKNSTMSEEKFAGLMHENCSLSFMTYYKMSEIKVGLPDIKAS